MVPSEVRGEGARPRARDAGEAGWDEDLYEGDGEADRTGTVQGPGARGGAATSTGVAEAEGTGSPATDNDADGGEPGARTARGSGHRRGGGSGNGDGDGSGGPAGRPRRKRRILRWSATVLAVVILGTAGAGYLYYQHLNGNIKKDDLNLGDSKDRAAEPTPNAAGQTPLNILLIGSDARDSKANQKLGGAKDTFGGDARADVQMLVHVSADRSNMSVVSMPRDTLLHLPKCTDPKTKQVYQATQSLAMTNDSLNHGGPGCTVATWEKLTGIHIDHFMMVDFAGVVSMADAIGGVPVCVDRNIYSHTSTGHGSGLKLEKGTTSVKGKQALQWLRTRYGFEDGSDIARTKAQHQYMNSMVRELRENATLSSPNKLRKLAETATKSLTVDDGLGTVKKLYDLSLDLRKVPTDRISMTTMPWVYSSDGNRVLPKANDAEKLFRLVREDVALDGKDKKKSPKEKEPTDPAAPDEQIAVQVVNGTRGDTAGPVGGRATQVAQMLKGEGFARAATDGSTLPSEETTVVRYPSADLEGDAWRIAKRLGIPRNAVEKSTDVSGVTLVVGGDWRSGTTYKAPEDDDKTPASAKLDKGSDTKACMKVDPSYSW
ncbi:LCP family protein [Streptomyces griseoaurantiacus]|uniref:LCP family protein n=1 Tax=Streptomyces griseoaurantiacus TaxID=68213 RepID=UPI0037A5E88B